MGERKTSLNWERVFHIAMKGWGMEILLGRVLTIQETEGNIQETLINQN